MGLIVVPVGARVLESETEQGFITQAGDDQWLNGCGAFVALAGWFCDAAGRRSVDRIGVSSDLSQSCGACCW